MMWESYSIGGSKPPSSPDWVSSHWWVVGAVGLIALYAVVVVYDRYLAKDQRRIRLFCALLVTGLVAIAVLATLGASATVMVLAGAVTALVSTSVPIIALTHQDARRHDARRPCPCIGNEFSGARRT